MKKIMLLLTACVFLLSGCSLDIDYEPQEKTEKVTEPETEAAAVKVTEPAAELEPEVILGFLDELDYTTEQIADMRVLLENVGITEMTELEIGNVSYGMQVIKGLAFTTGELAAPKEVRVQFNIENGTIYMVSIYCPSYGTSNQPTYLTGLEDRRADLYYDYEGGYLKKIDWKNKAVVAYE